MNTAVIGMCCVCVVCPSVYGGVVPADEFLVDSDRPHGQVGMPFTLVSDLPLALHATAKGVAADQSAVRTKRGVARVSAYPQMNRFRQRNLDDSDTGTSGSPDIWGSGRSVSGIHHMPRDAGRERDEGTADHGDPERLESTRLAPMVLLVVCAVVGTVFRWLWGASIRAVIS